MGGERPALLEVRAALPPPHYIPAYAAAASHLPASASSPSASPHGSLTDLILDTRRYMIAGALAGIAEHCVMFPVDTVKTRMQIAGAGEVSMINTARCASL